MSEPRQHDRWADYRGLLGMTVADRGTASFANRGLGAHVREPSVRMLILPSNPDWAGLSFDAWIDNLLPPQIATPWGGHLDVLGREIVTSEAALRVEPSRREDGAPWECYLGILRSGGVEMEMGSSGAWTGKPRDGHEPRRFFRLASIIEWMWTGLDLHRRLIEADLVRAGAVEATIGLQHLEGAVLSELGEGWHEPFDSFRSVPVATEADALLRIEVDDPASADGVKVAALELGDRVDNCFGVRQHRHLAGRGERAGEFVPGR